MKLPGFGITPVRLLRGGGIIFLVAAAIYLVDLDNESNLMKGFTAIVLMVIGLINYSLKEGTE